MWLQHEERAKSTGTSRFTAASHLQWPEQKDAKGTIKLVLDDWGKGGMQVEGKIKHLHLFGCDDPFSFLRASKHLTRMRDN